MNGMKEGGEGSRPVFTSSVLHNLSAAATITSGHPSPASLTFPRGLGNTPRSLGLSTLVWDIFDSFCFEAPFLGLKSYKILWS